jgi:hypothetical protein
MKTVLIVAVAAAMFVGAANRARAQGASGGASVQRRAGATPERPTPRASGAAPSNDRAAAARQDSSRAEPATSAAPPQTGLDLSLYGLANAGLDNYSAGTATLGDTYAARQRVFSSGSRLGLRGDIDLGAKGFRAVFQIESGLNLDNGFNTGQAGTNNPSAGFLSTRASWVGLEGTFGRVLVGRQDVYWLNGTVEQTAENYLSTGLPWMSGGNTGKAALGVALQSNLLSYTTPQMGKGKAMFYYSPDAGGISPVTSTVFPNAENAQANQKTNGRLLGASGTWASGPLKAILDIVQKKASADVASTGPAGFQDVPSYLGIKLGVGWTYQQGSQLSAIVSQVKTSNNGADTRLDYSARYLAANWEHTAGQWQFLGQVGTALKLSGCAGALAANCDNTGATGFLAGARYLFAKDVSAYGFVTQVSNGANIFQDYTDYRYSSVAPTSRAAGADPRIIGVGMRFSFESVLSASTPKK